MNVLEQFDQERVFYFFEEITKIPHGSGNEKALSDYLVAFAKERNLYYIQDEAYNVCIKKNGALGCENGKTVILQGHIDMVCEKNSDVIHDFIKEPLDIYVENGFIHARGTTLGADNGIAVAYMLALLDSNTIPHPPLEGVFTVDEEVGMKGAFQLDTSILEGKWFLNMDTEEEGVLLSGCAGGRRTRLDLPLVCHSNEEKGYKISIRGLKGGHSGADIHLQRANANCLMGRILDILQRELEYDLVSVDGGNMDNAICREADAVIVLRSNCALHMREVLEEIQISLDVEYWHTDAGILLEVEPIEEAIPMVVSEDIKEKIIQVLLQLPYGVQTMSADMEGLVESSNNIGIVKTLEDTIYFDCAMRSSVEHKKIRIYDQVCSVAKQVGGTVEIVNDYPGWEYNPNSEMLAFFGKVYEDMYGKAPRIEAIHAGLECGLFAQKIPGLDMVSIGPEMYDVHTPDERLSIASTLRVWDYLKTVLANIK